MKVNQFVREHKKDITDWTKAAAIVALPVVVFAVITHEVTRAAWQIDNVDGSIHCSGDILTITHHNGRTRTYHNIEV